jgi:hypothetical protein
MPSMNWRLTCCSSTAPALVEHVAPHVVVVARVLPVLLRDVELVGVDLRVVLRGGAVRRGLRQSGLVAERPVDDVVVPDVGTDKALESFDLALRSGRQVFVMLTKLDLTIAASLWLGALEELRFQAGEQAFTDAQLAAADASICAWLPDRSGLCTLIEDTISAENVVHQASLEEWLTKLDENTPEGREKYAREFLENCQALRRAVCGPLTTDGKPIDPMSVVSDAAGVTSDDPKTQARAIQKIASALNNAADTSLRLLIMNTEGVRVLLAIHRFKIQYGRVPASLDAIPVELFGARPPVFEGLVYRTGEDGKFTLYALGENGRDDGGKGRSLSNPTATADECFTAGRAERWK